MEQNKSLDLRLLNYYDKKIKKHVDDKTSTCFRDGGSILFEQLPIAEEQNIMKIYTVTDDFITDDRFINSEIEYKSGATVRVVKVGEEFKWDIYSTKTDVTPQIDNLYEITEDLKSSCDNLSSLAEEIDSKCGSALRRVGEAERVLDNHQQEIQDIRLDVKGNSTKIEQLGHGVDNLYKASTGQTLSIEQMTLTSLAYTPPTDRLPKMFINRLATIGMPKVKNLVKHPSMAAVVGNSYATIVSWDEDAMIVDMNTPYSDYSHYDVTIDFASIPYDKQKVFITVERLSGDEVKPYQVTIHKGGSYGSLTMQSSYYTDTSVLRIGNTFLSSTAASEQSFSHTQINKLVFGCKYGMTGRYKIRIGYEADFSELTNKCNRVMKQSANILSMDKLSMSPSFYEIDSETNTITVKKGDWREWTDASISKINIDQGGVLYCIGGEVSLQNTNGKYIDWCNHAIIDFSMSDYSFKIRKAGGTPTPFEQFDSKLVFIPDSIDGYGMTAFHGMSTYIPPNDVQELLTIPQSVLNLEGYGVGNNTLRNYIDFESLTYNRVCEETPDHSIVPIDREQYDISGLINHSGVIDVEPGYFIYFTDENDNRYYMDCEMSYITKLNINGDET